MGLNLFYIVLRECVDMFFGWEVVYLVIEKSMD